MRQLYTYFRSSAAWRVRIALAWKGLEHTAIPIHLLREGGQQHGAEYSKLNPQRLIPSLVEDGEVITQSLAICEYLEERYPTPPLLPVDHLMRAQVREIALAIACDIHPLNNLRVLQYLKGPLGQTEAAANAWYRHWIETGFAALEMMLSQRQAQQYCVGDAVSLADLCLVPQVFNARRFEVDLQPYPTLARIDAHLSQLPAFAESHPSKQPDAA